MGMPAPETKEWTYEMLETLPDDGNRYEIIDGELLVTPAPAWSHQRVLWNLCVLFDTYLRQHPFWHGLFAPADVVFDARNVVQPDLFIVPLVDGKAPQSLEEAGKLLLAIEVLSPSSHRADRTKKRILYQRFVVPEYWIVDSVGRLIERWRLGDERPEILTGIIEWLPSLAYPPLRIDLDYFFARVHGEAR
jgi:Uma2 family endonuclease